jgi:sugar (pentulose or hexulose) kinase
MHILALDVGTSAVKAAVLDTSSMTSVGSIARAGFDVDHPTSEAAEVPVARLWEAVTAAAREAVRSVPDPRFHIDGIGLGVLTPGLVLLDSDDQPLMPIWTHLDQRSRPAARLVWGSVGEEFLQSTGNRPLPGSITAVGFKQLVTDDPHLIGRVRSYLHVNGWLALHMTGEKAFDPGNASFTGLFNTLSDRQWSPRWCEYFEVDCSWLPPILDGTATVGTLRSAAAAELGVAPGLPVKLGVADTSCAILATGMKEGDLLHLVGTTQALVILTRTPRPNPQRLTRLLGVGEQYVHASHNPVGGVALEWIRKLCFGEQTATEFYQRSIPEARQRRTPVVLDPPYLAGHRLEIETTRAAFRELTLSTDRLDLLAAVLQALVQEHERAMQALGERAGWDRIFLTGGGAEVVRQLIPAYAGARVIEVENASLYGIARLFG